MVLRRYLPPFLAVFHLSKPLCPDASISIPSRIGPMLAKTPLNVAQRAAFYPFLRSLASLLASISRSGPTPFDARKVEVDRLPILIMHTSIVNSAQKSKTKTAPTSEDRGGLVSPSPIPQRQPGPDRRATQANDPGLIPGPSFCEPV